ncbi:hypothetical protein OH784_21675 [Ectobacillus funiculus]|uniref:hypothetical protein n=1 Tax=Ectobacillus funiculus TaxID=137993 RepID=UPI003977EDA8
MEDIREIKQEQEDMQRDIRNPETQITVNGREITDINKQLEKSIATQRGFCA